MVVVRVVVAVVLAMFSGCGTSPSDVDQAAPSSRGRAGADASPTRSDAQAGGSRPDAHPRCTDAGPTPAPTDAPVGECPPTRFVDFGTCSLDPAARFDELSPGDLTTACECLVVALRRGCPDTEPLCRRDRFPTLCPGATIADLDACVERLRSGPTCDAPTDLPAECSLLVACPSGAPLAPPECETGDDCVHVNDCCTCAAFPACAPLPPAATTECDRRACAARYGVIVNEPHPTCIDGMCVRQLGDLR